MIASVNLYGHISARDINHRRGVVLSEIMGRKTEGESSHGPWMYFGHVYRLYILYILYMV